MGEADQSAAGPVPEGYHAVTPFVIAKGAAQFIDFMKSAFDATEIARVADEHGAIGHAEVRIGDSVVMTFDAKELGNLWWLMSRIEDVSPEDQERRYGEQRYIDAMSYVQGTDFFADK